MDLSIQLQQKYEMKLALTPQLKQSLEILKLSIEELETYIKEQASTNPLIELKDSTIEMARLDGIAGRGLTSQSEESYDPFSKITDGERSMEYDLMEQLAMQKNLTIMEKKVILYFIRSLNNSGYLECDTEEVAQHFKLPITICEKMLNVLQGFEPAGVGARNLAECLLLQLVRKKNAPLLATTFVQSHLEDLANRQFQLLAHQYKVSVEEVEQTFAYIQQLNPHPFFEVNTVRTEYVVPDIIVEAFDGEYIIRVNDGRIPHISINTYYEELLRSSIDDETNKYLKTKLSDAFLLIKGIEQRHETLYKVTKIILDKQKEFLTMGKKALKPLRLKDISDIVELHISTISRAISAKYIQTPQGIFPIKDFFVRGVKSESGEVESTFLIKEKIRTIIENENSKRPLSDQKIANILMAEGIQIARRTVAKYREELGIPQSTVRSKKE